MSISDATLQETIQKELSKLEKLSPTQITARVAGHRRGINEPASLLAIWLSEKLDQEKITIKTVQNVDRNIEVSIHQTNELTVMIKFHVGTSLQDFLGIRKRSDQVPGASLSAEQAILVRAIVDREGGDERTLILRLLNEGFVNSAVVKKFVRRLKNHPEWHAGMHDVGLYPVDIFSAYKKICKEAKDY